MPWPADHFERAAADRAGDAADASSRQETTFAAGSKHSPTSCSTPGRCSTVTLVGARMATGDPTGVERSWTAPTMAGPVGVAANERRPPIVFDHDEFTRLPAQIAIPSAPAWPCSPATPHGPSPTRHAAPWRSPTPVGPSPPRRVPLPLAVLAHWSMGDLDAARRRYADAVDSFERAGFIPDVLGCSLGLADIQIAQGRLRRRDDEPSSPRSGSPVAHRRVRGVADMHVGLSELRLECDDLDGAARHLEAASRREHGHRTYSTRTSSFCERYSLAINSTLRSSSSIPVMITRSPSSSVAVRTRRSSPASLSSSQSVADPNARNRTFFPRLDNNSCTKVRQ